MEYFKRITKLAIIINDAEKLSEVREIYRDINNGGGEYHTDEIEKLDSILLNLGKNISDLDVEEIKSLHEELNKNTDDFYIELSGEEYRFIEHDAIWDIYVEAIQQIIEDSYDLPLDDLPSFIAFEIDWEATARNCYIDGYGHTFSGYDGSEIESDNYYIFRNN